MPHFNRTFGQHRATYECPTFSHVFPEVEAAVRSSYPPDRGYSIRAAKGKKEWTIFVHKGLTTGFRIDFVPVRTAFGPPEVEIRVYRSSALQQLFYNLMVGLLSCVVGGYYIGNFMGWWGSVDSTVIVLGILLGIVILLTPPTIAGFCMYIGGRLTDEELAAIGELVDDVLKKRGARECQYVATRGSVFLTNHRLVLPTLVLGLLLGLLFAAALATLIRLWRA